jgi:general L-amino acid transport system permease protein
MTPQQPASGGVRPGHPGRHASVPPWRDRRVQRVVVQVIVILVVGLVGLLLWNNLTSAMARTNLTFGLGFLSQTAGFEISEGLIPFAATNTYGRAIQVGLLNTLYVSIIGIILSTILGVIVGIARLSRNWLLNRIAAGFVELMRHTPLLVQLFILYFAVLLQLPGIADSISLPGSVFLNQRGLFLPRPEATGTFPLWLGFILAGIWRDGLAGADRPVAGAAWQDPPGRPSDWSPCWAFRSSWLIAAGLRRVRHNGSGTLQPRLACHRSSGLVGGW